MQSTDRTTDHDVLAAEETATGGVDRRRRWRVAGLITAGVLLAGAIASIPGVRRGIIDPAGREPVTGITEIEMRDDFWEYFAFTPSVVEVEQGTTLTWTSSSRAAHNVVFTDADGERVASPLLDAGDEWSHTFDASTYPNGGDLLYVCTLHEGMDGRVVVTVSSSSRG